MQKLLAQRVRECLHLRLLRAIYPAPEPVHHQKLVLRARQRIKHRAKLRLIKRRHEKAGRLTVPRQPHRPAQNRRIEVRRVDARAVDNRIPVRRLL